MMERDLVEDVVRSLGYLCLGTRLRRIGEQLQSHTQQIMEDAGVAIQAAQYPLLAAVDRLGPLSIGDMAAAVGITQPGATRAAGLLVKAGYLEVQRVRGDQRVKLMALTAKGKSLVALSKRDVWPLIERAVADVCRGLSGPLLDQLGALETGLNERPLHQRLRAKARAGR
jgi:DNA-binding MarR family transcriptional regulator